jgi:hypothetical protein
MPGVYSHALYIYMFLHWLNRRRYTVFILTVQWCFSYKLMPWYGSIHAKLIRASQWRCIFVADSLSAGLPWKWFVSLVLICQWCFGSDRVTCTRPAQCTTHCKYDISHFWRDWIRSRISYCETRVFFVWAVADACSLSVSFRVLVLHGHIHIQVHVYRFPGVVYFAACVWWKPIWATSLLIV